MNWQAFRLCALWCWHQLLTLGLAVLVVVAVMVGVSRELLPLADDYRPRLEQALSQRLGLPVTLQRLEGEADGLQLFLRLVNLDLRDPARPAAVLLRVPEVELRPAVWQSLLHRELRVDVRLHGLDIHLDQQPDGRFQLRELASLARRDAASAERTLGYVLRQPVLALSESRVAITLNDLPGITLAGIDIVNRNDGESHRLAGRLRLPGTAEELALQLELDGDPLRWRQGQARAWLRLPVVTLDGWLPALAGVGIRYGLALEHLRGGGQYWLALDRGRLVSARAEVDWRDVAFRRDDQPRRVQDLRGEFAWSRNAGGWQLAGSHLRGRIDGENWPLPALALRGGPDVLTVAARNTNVRGALRLLAWVPLPPALAEWLRDATPEGQVGGLRADLAARPEGGWSLRRLDVEAVGLAARAAGRRPGLEGLGGWLRWTPDRAWAGLGLRQGSLHLPTFQPDPIPVFHLEGRLRLAREGAGWRVDSGRLNGANADLGASGVLSLALPPAPAQPRISLAAQVQQARAGSAWRYVPVGAAGARTVDWLRQHLTAGLIPQAELYLEGPLHPHPEEDPSRLLLRADLRRASLDYAAGWPGLRELDAEVIVAGPSLTVQGGSARLLDGSRGEGLAASIPDFRDPVLSVSGNLASTGADVTRLFRDSPLARQLPGLTDVLALEGPVNGRLVLAMPLRGGRPDIDVWARLADNRLFLKPARLTVNRLAGELRYSSRDGLSSPRLDAELLEAPVRADIRSEGGARPGLQVNVEGSAGVPALRRWLGSSLLDFASGAAPYHARISVPAGGSPRLQLDSSLAGLRLALPAPLGKTQAEAVPLRYQVGFGGAEQFGRLQYGQRMSGGLVWAGSRLDRVLLRLDSSSAAWPQQPGLEIEGRLARLDIAEWRPVLARQARRERAATVAARGDDAMPGLTRLDLDVRELMAEGRRLRNARLGLRRLGKAWQLGVDSDELAGSARLPDAAGSEIGVTFTRLQWPLPAAPAPGKAAAAAGLNPVAGLGNRPVALNGEGLRMAAWPGLGPLSVKARLLPLPAGLRVEDIALRGPMLDFRGQLDWQWRGGDSSRLQGSVATSNVAALLAAFGIKPPLAGRGGAVELDLSWPAAPDRAAPELLDGHVRVALESGRLLNVSTGTSASRIFGWFSLENLQRRFKGDFADVTRRGLAFDSITLEGTLAGGVMAPASVRMKGPTLQADGQGRLDLGQRKVDQHYTVTVPMTSAVPIAAVVMAGPVVGGAVAAAQMAFDKQIDKVTQLHYHVSGNWSDPRVERLANRPSVPAQAGRAR